MLEGGKPDVRVFHRFLIWNAACEGNHMPPIDPVKPIHGPDRSSMSPTFDEDEDVNLSLVEEGMEVADDETRDAVKDAYESLAREGDDPKEELAEIELPDGESDWRGQEVAAIHQEEIFGSSDDDDDLELFSDEEITPDHYEQLEDDEDE